MGELSPWHWLIVIGVFALLFGAKRLPDAARAIGRSTRILKSELSGLRSDDAPAPTETTTPSPAAPSSAAPSSAAPGSAAPGSAAGAPTVEPTTTPAAAQPVSAEKSVPQAAAG